MSPSFIWSLVIAFSSSVTDPASASCPGIHVWRRRFFPIAATVLSSAHTSAPVFMTLIQHCLKTSLAWAMSSQTLGFVPHRTSGLTLISIHVQGCGARLVGSAALGALFHTYRSRFESRALKPLGALPFHRPITWT